MPAREARCHPPAAPWTWLFSHRRLPPRGRAGYSYHVFEENAQTDKPGQFIYAHNFLPPSVESTIAKRKVRAAQFFRWAEPNKGRWINIPRSDYGKDTWAEKRW